MVYCINCDKNTTSKRCRKVNYIVKERIVDLFIWNLSVRANIMTNENKRKPTHSVEWPTCVEKYAVCKNCSEEIYVGKIADWNVRERLLKRIEVGDLVYTAGSEEWKKLNKTLWELDNRWRWTDEEREKWQEKRALGYSGEIMLDERDWDRRENREESREKGSVDENVDENGEIDSEDSEDSDK